MKNDLTLDRKTLVKAEPLFLGGEATRQGFLLHSAGAGAGLQQPSTLPPNSLGRVTVPASVSSLERTLFTEKVEVLVSTDNFSHSDS